MQERSELRILFLPRLSTHAVERTWRTYFPALCPGCGVLVHVSLGRVPFLRRLHLLRRGVRQLRRSYGPVCLPRPVHHRLAASGLPGAANGAICRRRSEDLPVLAQKGSVRALAL